MERLPESVVTLLLSLGSKNVGSGRVSVFVTWDPYILLQSFSNLDMLSETEQPTNIWYSNDIFICDLMAK
jgi:hypothetical protein